MNSKNNFPLDVFNVVFCFRNNFPTGTLLPYSVLILSMAKNQSDLENLVRSWLMLFGREFWQSASVVHFV